jgi:hypothetical protein
MERFLDTVDQRYGGVHPLLRDNGTGTDDVRRLTELLITYDRKDISCE